MMEPPDQTPAVSSAAVAKMSPQRWRRWLGRIGVMGGLVYLGLCVVIYALQNYLLFPGHSTQGQAVALIRESTNHELIHLTTRGGEKIVAIFGAAQDADGQPRADAARQPTLLFFYGNGMCLSDTFGEFKRFRQLGLNVLIPEYVGYGMSSGKPSEKTLYETADAAYEHLISRHDIDAKKIIAAGWSLGAAVAINTAHRRPVIGLATFSAFTSLPDMGRNLLPWLPVSLVISYKFDNLGKIAKINCPIFIAHGLQDQIIPQTMSQRLYDEAGKSPRVTKVWVESDHNNIFETQEALYEPLARWVDSIR